MMVVVCLFRGFHVDVQTFCARNFHLINEFPFFPHSSCWLSLCSHKIPLHQPAPPITAGFNVAFFTRCAFCMKHFDIKQECFTFSYFSFDIQVNRRLKSRWSWLLLSSVFSWKCYFSLIFSPLVTCVFRLKLKNNFGNSSFTSSSLSFCVSPIRTECWLWTREGADRDWG